MHKSSVTKILAFVLNVNFVQVCANATLLNANVERKRVNASQHVKLIHVLAKTTLPGALSHALVIVIQQINHRWQ